MKKASFFLPLIILLAITCKKKDVLQEVSADKPINFTVDSTTVLPSQLLTLTADRAINKDTCTAKFGSVPVTLVKLDSFHYGLQVPVLAAGDYLLDLKAAGGVSTPKATIRNYPSLSNAAAVINGFAADYLALIDSLEKYSFRNSISPDAFGFMRQLSSQFSRNAGSLSPDQQQALAYQIAHTNFDRKPLNSSTTDTSYLTGRMLQGQEPFDLLLSETAIAASETASALGAGRGASMFGQMWSATGRSFTGVSYLFSASVFVYLKEKAFQQHKKTASVAAIADGPLLTANGIGSSSNPVLAGNGQTITQKLLAQFRTIQVSDGNGFNSRVSDFVNQNKQLQSRDQEFSNSIARLKNLYSNSFNLVTATYTRYVSPVRETAVQKTAEAKASFVTVTNVSHPSITVRVSEDVSGTLQLTFSNPDKSITTITPFTFQLSYSQTAIQKTLTITEQAKYTVLSSIPIGSQVWMGENLAVTNFRNGESIPYVGWGPTWATLKTPAWCYYNNDPATVPVYGLLYNWYAVADSRGLAPAGWHVASDAEWTTLINNQGGYAIAGGKLKAVSVLWTVPNTGASNSSGFSALPGGFRGNGGTYDRLGKNGSWWSSNQFGANGAYFHTLNFDNAAAGRAGGSKQDGLSVRCVLD